MGEYSRAWRVRADNGEKEFERKKRSRIGLVGIVEMGVGNWEWEWGMKGYSGGVGVGYGVGRGVGDVGCGK